MELKKMETGRAGFSLIEVMIALAILSIVLTGVVTMFTQSSRYNSKQEMMTDIAQAVRSAKTLMTDEIRSAGTNPDNASFIGFQLNPADDTDNTDANSIHFTRDIDDGVADAFYRPDGDADDPSEDISYYRVDSANNILNPGDNTVGTLIRATAGVGQPVIDNVVDLSFLYFDRNNVQIAPATMNSQTVLDSIRSVEVTITGQVDRPNLIDNDYRTWTQTFRVYARNM